MTSDLSPVAEVAAADPDSGHRKLGLLSASTIVAASMIGAAVYTTSGYAIGALGEPIYVLYAWCVAGVIAICGAICYGALAHEFTASGGEYLFLSRSVHPIAGLMVGWVSLLAGFTGAIAFAATTFSEYLVSGDPFTEKAIAIGLVIGAATLHSIGVRPGARVQNAIVLLKIVLISAFIVIAFFNQWPRDPIAEATILKDNPPPVGFPLLSVFATQLMWISLSYSGFNAAVYVAGEVVRPRRNVPRALVLGTIGVTIIYVALNTIFVFAPSSESIRFNEQVATSVAHSIGGVNFERFIRVVILFGLFTSVTALVMTGPRVYAKMAEDGFLPAVFRIRENGPRVAIWIQAGLAMVVICFSTLESLLKYLGFTLSISAALSASLVFWLHRRESSNVRVPLYPIPPILFVGGTLVTATLTAINEPRHAVAGVITLGFGVLFYPWYRMRQSTKQQGAN